MNFSTLWTSCFYSLERRIFGLEYRKRTFTGSYCLKKKKLKNGHFWTITMGLPLWKNVNFSTFWTSIFYSLERRFFVLECRKRHFPGLYCLKKKKLEKWPFWHQSHGLTALEKCQFFIFSKFWFIYPRKAFFRSRIS